MATYQDFEQLPVWQEAAHLYNLVLDLLENPVPLTPGFRNQLDRAALSVSNNIAEGFARSTTKELLSFIFISRGSAAEVRSMLAVVKKRPKLKPCLPAFEKITASAESCLHQLSAWAASVDNLPFSGPRRLTQTDKASRDAQQKAQEFRLNFLRNLKPSHPLYNSPEARSARGEIID